MISKLGYRDSNPEMQESKSCALPFGDTPLFRRVLSRQMFYSVISTIVAPFP